MKFNKLLFIAALISFSSAHALQIPNNSKADSRIQNVLYKDNDVVKLEAVNGYITTITFDPSETVQSYGSGYSTAWEFATVGNRFFLKPKDKDGTTNIVIVTNKRIYSIDVNLIEDAAKATYQLNYTYPQIKKEPSLEELEKDAVDAALKSTDPNVLDHPIGNYQYTMNFGESANSALIAPIEAYDDGTFTYLKFRNNTDFPAVYSVNSDGEAITNSHVENQMLVIHGVFKELRLRSGMDVVGVYNENYTGGSLSNNRTSTTVNGLERQIRGNN